MSVLARRARVRAFAKINLCLRVLDRRPDGYHELRTIFQTISLADELELEWERSRRSAIALDDPSGIPDNLARRAAELVLAEGAKSCRVTLRLKKRIPMGAGLGGGSSDAAAVLLALPVLAGIQIPVGRLIELGAQLGSDVPFFLLGGTAFGLGRGTELYPLPEPKPLWGVLISPGIHVSTAGAYRDLGRGLTNELHDPIMRGLPGCVWTMGEAGAEAGWRRAASNDFEQTVFPKYPRIQAIQHYLAGRGGEPARMTGSGSAVFGLFDGAALARAAAQAFPAVSAEEKVAVFRTLPRRRYQGLWQQWLAEHSAGQQWPPRGRYGR